MTFLASKHRAVRPLSSLAAVLALSAAGPAAAAGPITAVNGDVSVGQSITVEGAGFGAQGPVVVLFDDFDCPGCTSGEPIALDATVGEWSSTQNVPTYTDDQSHAGLSMLASNYLPTSGGCPEEGACESTSNFSRANHTFSSPPTEVFWSFWRNLPPTDTFPLESCDNINWKVSWLYGTQEAPDNVINDWIVPVYNSQNHADGFEEPSVGSNAGFTEDEGGGNCGVSMYPMYLVEKAAPGNWIRYSTHVKGSADCDGSFRLWEIPFIASETAGYACGDDHNTCEMLRKERVGIQTLEEAWHTLTLNAYARNKEDGCDVASDVSVPRYDDAYIAVGPGAQARVEIASQETWGDAAHANDLNMSIFPPTQWSDGSVTCTVAPGSFAEGAQVYLFVIDANGEVSDQDEGTPGAQGFPITLGTTTSTGSGGGSTGTGGETSGPGTGGGSPGTGGENAGAGSPSGGTGSSNGAGDAAGTTSNGTGAAAGGGSPAEDGEGDGCGCSTLPARGRGAGVLAALVVAGLVSRRRRA